MKKLIPILFIFLLSCKKDEVKDTSNYKIRFEIYSASKDCQISYQTSNTPSINEASTSLNKSISVDAPYKDNEVYLSIYATNTDPNNTSKIIVKAFVDDKAFKSDSCYQGFNSCSVSIGGTYTRQ